LWILDDLARIESKLNQVLAQQARIFTLLKTQGEVSMALADDVNDLVAAVEDRKTVGDSVMVLLNELHEMLKSQISDPASLQALQGAIAALKAKNKEVSDAVIANTPNAS
jgi:hypothetical protein